MELLILIVFVFLLVFLLGGLVSVQNAIIKPVVAWLHPPGSGMPAPTPKTDRDAWLEMVRKRKADRLKRHEEMNR